MIARKKDAEQNKVVAMANAVKAKQDAITAEEQGKARIAEAKAIAEVEKITAVVEAQKKAEVAKLEYTGLLIQSVSSDSDLYGKINKGDTITAINYKEITTDDMVLDIIENCRAGDKINITFVTEDGLEKEMDVKLGANIGQSSYTTQDSPSIDGSMPSQGGIFDFPEGE